MIDLDDNVSVSKLAWQQIGEQLGKLMAENKALHSQLEAMDTTLAALRVQLAEFNQKLLHY